MGGQNRSSYARSNGSANRGLAAFFRGAFILLVALTLSFGLGFFVIARMIPPGVNDSSGGSNGGGTGAATQAPAHSEHRAQGAGAPISSSQIASKPVQSASQDGPVLLPENNVQTPDKLEANGANSSLTASDHAETTDPKTHVGDKPENDAAANSGSNPSTSAEPGDPSNLRHPRRGRTGGTESVAVQQAGSLDSNRSQPNDPPKTTASDSAPAVKTGLYRVQIGVYSTREKAEEVVRAAADKGITTTLHVLTRDGRTLYRVQQSSHRDRAKAELDRQKLLDAGFDATIINPS